MKKPVVSPLLPLVIVSALLGLFVGIRDLRHGEVMTGVFALVFCLAQSFGAFLLWRLAVIAATPGFKGDRWFKFKPDPKRPSDVA